MPRPRIHTKLSLIATLLLTSLVAVASDDDVLRARQNYDKQNAIALSADISALQSERHVLAPYADYWLMLLNLEEANLAQVQTFLSRYADYPFADRLRGEYLKKMGKVQNWADFMVEWPNYQGDDIGVACYAAEARFAQGEAEVLTQSLDLWLQPKEQAANCNRLFDLMQAKGALDEDELYARLRMALAGDKLALAKAIMRRTKTYTDTQAKLLEKAYAGPTATLTKRSISYSTRIGRELNLYALQRLAKTDSQAALRAFSKVAAQFSAEEKAYFYGRLAQQAALRLEPEALAWFKLAANTDLDKDQLAWYARMALRAQDWAQVQTAIGKMQPAQAEEGAWRYWRARALKAQNQTLEANILFAKLSTERHFYGWLAQEDLESIISAPTQIYTTSDTEVAEIAKNPAMQRVEALQRIDMRWEAKIEWAHATQDFADTQLLAAAKFAQTKKWYDLAIITADKTTEQHDFTLRYPTPYRDLIKPSARSNDVDEAWVYGITRQESRFMHFAKSGVGAAGLMQLMPATASWAAKRVGISDYHNSMIHDLDTNIALGTYYMAYTKDLMNGQETMATAAYNAGPSRAKKWAANQPLEGAIYIESIPFSETRTYVQKVMANAHLYAQRLGLKPMPLKTRVGTIPGKTMVAPAADVGTNTDKSADANAEATQ